MRMKWAARFAGLVAIAAALYSGYWWLGAERLRDGVDGWTASMRARGWTVAHGPLDLGGFPTRFVLTARSPVIGAPVPAGGWGWRGPELVAIARPWSVMEMKFHAPGLHRITPGVGPDGAARPPLRIEAERAFGRFRRIAAARETHVLVELGGLTVPADGEEPARTIEMVEATAVLPDRPGRADLGAIEPAGPVVDLRLTGLDLGAAPFPELGPRIDSAALSVKLIGPLVPGPPVRLLSVWRDGGGTVKIDRVALRWRQVNVTGQGTFALDGALQPIAALTTKIGGYGVLLDIMVARGAIEAGDASSVRLGLDLVARATSGRSGVIAVPLTVQDRRLSVGPVNVMRLPRIVWRN